MLRRAEGLCAPSKPRTPDTSAVHSETHGAEHFSVQRQSEAPMTAITTVEAARSVLDCSYGGGDGGGV